MIRHTLRSKVAFRFFLVIALAEVAVGLRYLLSPRIMPYHQQALGVSWAELAPREQMLLIALLKGTGLCALITGVTMGTVLFIPFRRGESWARWAIAGLGLTTLVPAAWEAVTLAAATGAATPWPILLTAIVLVLAGFSLAGPIDTNPDKAPAGGARPTPLVEPATNTWVTRRAARAAMSSRRPARRGPSACRRTSDVRASSSSCRPAPRPLAARGCRTSTHRPARWRPLPRRGPAASRRQT
jgi:hypothetical protein